MSRVYTNFRVVVRMLLVPLLAFAQSALVPPQPLTLDAATAYGYKSIGGDQGRSRHVDTTL
jgi:hypothetical protein